MLQDVTASGWSEAAPLRSLSDELRFRTTRLHEEADTLLRLPGAIRDREDYRAWLGRFYGMYEPLEREFTVFFEWDALGIPLPAPSHSASLACDISALGIDPGAVPRAAGPMLPELPTFAHALGALYVLEGATLGGRIILRDLQGRIADPVDRASRFFGGRGDAVGPMWRSFRAALDGFGHDHPQCRDDVVVGAERGFRAILAWFAPFCAHAANRP